MITAPTGSQQFCSRATPGLAGFRKKFSYQLLPMGGATPPALSHRSGCSRQAARDGQKARYRSTPLSQSHKFLDTTHRKVLLPLHLQV